MAADNELENLKTDCITALRKGDEDAFDAAALKFQESSAGDLQFKMETLGLLACLALKQNYCRSALKALNLLSVCSLDIAPEDAQTENVFLQNSSGGCTNRKCFFAESALCRCNGGAHA